MTPAKDYADLVAAVAREGDDTEPYRALLLWFMRKVMQVAEADEYEAVFDPDSQQVDGLWVETSPESIRPTLYLFECKVSPGRPTKLTKVHIDRFAALVRRLDEGGFDVAANREIRSSALRTGLTKVPWSKHFDLKPVLVVAGGLTSGAVSAANEHDIQVFDLPWLARLARALVGPGLLNRTVRVPCPADRRFLSTTGVGDIAVCELPASVLAEWPGIEDRTLFGLNVRGELRQNRVRTGLDTAIETVADHANFLAYHNGLTVLCHEIDATDPTELAIHGLSVVNGAQSLLAFWRKREALVGSELHVLVKFVTYDDQQPGFATEVARRSNTQTAVNPRNLRANDPRQRALVEEFQDRYKDYSYVTKPDATVQPPGSSITNDDAAQWLCAIYQERPWVAVKRTELFREPEYERIFNPSVGAGHIVLAKLIYDAVQSGKPEFPALYRGSWRLTALMAMYLVAQAMRSDPVLKEWLESPDAMVGKDHSERLAAVVAAVAATMEEYHRDRVTRFGHDDFKVDFKRENTALDLAANVADDQLLASG